MNPSTHIYRLRILESHLDTFGHVNHAIYLRLYEEARWEMVTERGHGLERVKETGVGLIILDAHVRYRRELRVREWVRIETHWSEYRKRIGKVRQAMYGESGKLASDAEFSFALFNMATRSMVAATPEWLKAMKVGDEPVKFPPSVETHLSV